MTRPPRLQPMHGIANQQTAMSSRFSSLLRHWRNTRRLSQIELAFDADISAKHLCFLETGRSHPSRDMVQQLSAALDLPLEEQNVLHIAAGFVPPYGEHGLDTNDLGTVRRAFDFILAQQEPYPAIVIDGRWDIRIRNEASRRLFSPFHQAYRMDPALANNAMHTVFHPQGLRPFIVNWAEFASQMLQILRREVAQGSKAAAQLLKEISAYPGLPRERHAGPGGSPVMTMQLKKDDLRLSFFSMFTALAMPADVTLQQLKIECFFPADDATAAQARQLSL